MEKRKIVFLIIIIVFVGIISFGIYKLFLEDIIHSPNSKIALDNGMWRYDVKENVYYILGVDYTINHESSSEILNIYVPGEYLDCESKKNGTYNCKINSQESIGNYNAMNAPIIMPVMGTGFVGQNPPATYAYSSIAKFISEGFVYVYPGFRGRNNKEEVLSAAPWQVVDLKAAIRYLKFNRDVIPGDTENIFMYGQSSGAALASIVATSGNSKLYTPYLETVGAIMQDSAKQELKDDIKGVMVWCPTLLAFSNEAYEWNMGQYSLTKTRFKNNWTNALSEDLAKAYGTFINDIKLKDPNGDTLLLLKTEEGIYNSGTYYYYIKGIIENSLLNYLTNNYETEEAINKYMRRYPWASVSFDPLSVTIADVGSFIKELKIPNKGVPAFDTFNKNKAENNLFGTEKNNALHWDNTLANILKKNEESYKVFKDYESYVKDYVNDISIKDRLGTDSITRQNMYDPLYYLIDYYDGYKNSSVAPNWRIRSGIIQTETPLTTEVNLALALQNYGKINVDFATIWNKGHTQAEEKGDATVNFINWVKSISN